MDSGHYWLQPSDYPQKQPLWRLYREVTQYEYVNPDRAFEVFEQVWRNLENYTGTPDDWHNAAMVAARVGHRDAELRLIQCGLMEWPEDVDLLCDELQLRITSHRDPERARALVRTLEEMPLQKKGAFWRYWVYLAIYYARVEHDPQRAFNLLNEGLRYVRRENVMDILRNYRRVLVDSVPLRDIRDEKDLEDYHKWTLKTLEEQYLMGLRLGLENGYVLATELARLYQEQAGRETKILGPEPDGVENGTGAREARSQEREDYLSKALYYLDLAEKLYTGDPNHPISEIYEQRLRILMAQRKYGEALQLIQSLRYTLRGRIRQDFSPIIMWERAARGTGQSLEELEDILGIPRRTTGPEMRPDVLGEVVNLLFADDGRLLEELANRYPPIREVLFKVYNRLTGAR